MKKHYSEQDLHDLISKVETEFAQHLAKAEAEAKTLEKTEIEKCGEIKKTDDEHKVEEQQENQDHKPEEGHDYSDDDKEELKKLYSEMSDAERALHKAALEACESKDGMLEKSEDKQETKEAEIPKESKELSLAKAEIETLKKSNEELHSQFQELVKTLNTKLVRPAPARKAVTELGVLEKSEKAPELPKSKNEIVKILTKKAREEDLKKSDRDAINAYTIGQAGLESISHLLK